ncbi:MAG: PssD/Cps14F family polysaccharide biosynthesis glycosyltransferase [Candidatus Diapherotrites archaeon]|nr:PssD/Cps14F family polysaccharide biosynthesis glycosyltransferase [Candidatus Diapherotrites archaeon]
MKICLAASAGGHLTELVQLRTAWEKENHFYISDSRPNAIELSQTKKIYFVTVPRRNFLKLIWNFFQSLKIFLKEKPDIIISTGADVAVPICWIAKLFGKKLIFIESFCRINEPSESGKILYTKADLFLVQWKENLKFFPKAKYYGSVF